MSRLITASCRVGRAMAWGRSRSATIGPCTLKRPSWFGFESPSGQTGVDPHLRIGMADDLECLLNRWKPAHTQIIFDYSGLSNPGDPMAGTP